MLTDIVDYLNNNLIIAHYCGFDISSPLPSYWTFDRFLKNFDPSVLSDIMEKQVLAFAEPSALNTSFIGLNSTPVFANTSQNNPKSQEDCRLGVHSASNQTNEKNYAFYWEYKNHVLVDCISGNRYWVMVLIRAKQIPRKIIGCSRRPVMKKHHIPYSENPALHYRAWLL